MFAPFRLIVWHKALVGIPVLLGLGLAVLAYKMTPARYVAQSALALDARITEVIPSAAVISRLPQENPVLRTELDVIASRSMAENVLRRLKPETLEQLSQMIELPSMRAKLALAFRGNVAAILGDGEADAPPATSPDVAAATAVLDPAENTALVDLLRSNTQVSNDGRSYTIFVNVTAGDPALAALLANTYAEAYLAYQTNIQVAATRRVSEWLGQKVEELRSKLGRSEEQVGALRRGAGLLKSNGPSLTEQRFAALNAEIARAGADRVEAEAKLATAVELARTPAALDTFADVVREPLIVSLRDQLATLQRSQQKLEMTGASNSPGMPSLAVQSKAILDQIAAEMQRVVKSMESTVTVARRREEDLKASLRQAIADASAENQDSIRLDQLERDASATRTIYDTFLNRYKQTIEQEGFVAPEASLITRADPPRAPNSPRLLPLLALGLAGGLGTGLGLAFVRERLDARVCSGEIIEETTGSPIVALLPDVGWRFGGAQRYPIGDSMFSQSIRKLQAAITLSRHLKKAKVIAIASALPGEGKTTLSVALARSIALSGRSVVLVDGDTCRPEVSQLMRVEGRSSLADYLNGRATLDEAIQKDPLSNADVITSTPLADELPPDRLDHALRDLAARLRQRYDFVLIDTPPVLMRADAATIAAYADAVLLVVRWQSTTYEAAASAVRELDLCSVDVAGIVLNRMSRGRHAAYGVSYGARHATQSDPARSQGDAVQARQIDM
ncbi:polysaccharide biosynthesis tyrosine autokinase [Bosea sp. 117]|uniref:GumC family protein n=1 Tax=Bosea sp. 117 TaxID=1125973 RepID=UPI000AF2F2D1|nr:polysaccharide biosynthesis tyrosine autokinase [Bosea sp. 117]